MPVAPTSGFHGPRTPPRAAPLPSVSVKRADVEHAVAGLPPLKQAIARDILGFHRTADERVSVSPGQLDRFLKALTPQERQAFSRVASQSRLQVPAEPGRVQVVPDAPPPPLRGGGREAREAPPPALPERPPAASKPSSAPAPATGNASATPKAESAAPKPAPSAPRPGPVPSRGDSGGTPAETALVPSGRPASAGSAEPPARPSPPPAADSHALVKPQGGPPAPARAEAQTAGPQPSEPDTGKPLPPRPGPAPQPSAGGKPTVHVTQNVQFVQNNLHVHVQGPAGMPGGARPQGAPGETPMPARTPQAHSLGGQRPTPEAPPAGPASRPEGKPAASEGEAAESLAGEGKKKLGMGAKIAAGIAALVAAFPILAVLGAKTSPSDTSAGTPGNGM